MSITVCLSTNQTLNYPHGGGHLWVYLNWALGLRALGCEVIWLETVTNKESVAASKSRRSSSPFRAKTATSTDAGDLRRVAGERCHPEETPRSIRARGEPGAPLLGRRSPAWRSDKRVPEPRSGDQGGPAAQPAIRLTRRGRRSVPAVCPVRHRPGSVAALDEPGIGKRAASRLVLHYRRDGRPARGAVSGHGAEVALYAAARVSARVAPGSGGRHGAIHDRIPLVGRERVVEFRGEFRDNNKRAAFLSYSDLPSRTSTPLELALCLAPRDKEESRLLEEKGWKIRHAWTVSSEPEEYRDYVQRSRGEFSIVKPSCVWLGNAWISDRTLCYLASAKPAVIQHTGPSRFLPDSEGLIRFRDLEEAARALSRWSQITSDTAGWLANWQKSTSMPRKSSQACWSGRWHERATFGRTSLFSATTRSASHPLVVGGRGSTYRKRSSPDT